jgi:uncharacterized protein
MGEMKDTETASATYQATIESWRQELEQRLRAGDGWLTLAGLFWLNEGRNEIGAGPENDIILPPGSALEHVGSVELRDGEVTLHAASEAVVTVNGGPVVSRRLQSDATGAPDLVAIGDLTLLVLQRGDRCGIRVRDRNNPARAAFAGRRWFPIRESYRLAATFIPHEPPRQIPIANVLGTTENTASPGYVVFAIDGQDYRLDALTESDQLWFIFRDRTSGESTYPAGRYLKAPSPRQGMVTLDFNMAYSPPCAFTPFATCPLPPPQNQLPVRIEAGELYGSGKKGV